MTEELIGKLGYLGIALLLLLGGLGLPVPEEAPIILAAVLSRGGKMWWPLALGSCLSGVLLAISALFFQAGLLTAVTQTLFWCVIFFLASAGASSAYLTVSEIFPLELRGQAIALVAVHEIGPGPLTAGESCGSRLGLQPDGQVMKSCGQSRAHRNAP